MCFLIKIFLIVVCSISTNSFSLYEEDLSKITYLSKRSYLQKDISSCYRWVDKKEIRMWKIGFKVFGKTPGNRDKLQRSFSHPDTRKKNNKAIYCMNSPVGAYIGGVREDGSRERYGSLLMRIDFVEESLVYDRNLQKYYQNGQEVSSSFPGAEGLNSDVFYANYISEKGQPWFQEYIIRNKSVIQSISFDDQSLQMSFYEGLDSLISGRNLPIQERHFFLNFYEQVRRDEYIDELIEAEKTLRDYWN